MRRGWPIAPWVAALALLAACSGAPPRDRPAGTTAAAGLPDWAQPLGTRDRVGRFVAAVKADLQRRGGVIRLAPGGQLTHPDLPRQPVSLAPLARACAQEDANAWPDVIAEKLDAILQEALRRAETLRLAGEWSWAGPRLAVRIWPRDQPAPPPSEAVQRCDLPGLTTVLVLDHGGHQDPVPAALAQAWGQTEAALFARGLENLSAGLRNRLRGTDLRDHGALVIYADSPMVAALAVRPEALDGVVGRCGAFLGLPCGDTLVVAPCDGATSLPALDRVCSESHLGFDAGPGSVAPDVFWWREGRWLQVPCQRIGNSVRAVPPRELLTVIGLRDGPRAPRPAPP